MLVQPEGETGRALKRKARSPQQVMKITGSGSDPVECGNECRSSVRVWAVEGEVESYTNVCLELIISCNAGYSALFSFTSSRDSDD